MATITVYLNITLYYFGRFIVCLLSENIDLFTFLPKSVPTLFSLRDCSEKALCTDTVLLSTKQQ